MLKKFLHSVKTTQRKPKIKRRLLSNESYLFPEKKEKSPSFYQKIYKKIQKHKIHLKKITKNPKKKQFHLNIFSKNQKRKKPHVNSEESLILNYPSQKEQ